MVEDEHPTYRQFDPELPERLRYQVVDSMFSNRDGVERIELSGSLIGPKSPVTDNSDVDIGVVVDGWSMPIVDTGLALEIESGGLFVWGGRERWGNQSAKEIWNQIPDQFIEPLTLSLTRTIAVDGIGVKNIDITIASGEQLAKQREINGYPESVVLWERDS